MDGIELMFGDKPAECVQYIIGEGFRKHTPEAMIHAAHKLQGIRALMCSWLEYDSLHGSAFAIQLGNEILRCYQAADLIKKGKL